ncbi:hypothetical protein BJV74DRAFT_563435 [Russula compacta]|nr:hypothetical protein BJV74DRAFT_563435 [Russula compacta]
MMVALTSLLQKVCSSLLETPTRATKCGAAVLIGAFPPNSTFVSIPHRLSPPLPLIPPDAYAQFRSFPKIVPRACHGPPALRSTSNYVWTATPPIYGGDDIHQYPPAPPSRMPYPSHSRNHHGLTTGATLAGLRVPHMKVFHGSACFANLDGLLPGVGSRASFFQSSITFLAVGLARVFFVAHLLHSSRPQRP